MKRLAHEQLIGNRPRRWLNNLRDHCCVSFIVMKTFLGIVKQVLVAIFYKEAQLGRSLGKNNHVFKRELLKAIVKLSKKVDTSALKNADIRNSIKKVSARSGVSLGQAQKVINVYLKYYCILSGKPPSVIRELDCPLDGKILSRYTTKGLRKISLRAMRDFDNYVAWQDHLKVIGNGVRLWPDIQTYDKKRIESFLT